MATLCRERYLTREEMKTQYQAGGYHWKYI